MNPTSYNILNHGNNKAVNITFTTDGYRFYKKKIGDANTGTNDTINTSPNKKWDKSKICKLCDDPHLMINYSKLAKYKWLLIQTSIQKQPIVLSESFHD